MFPQSFSNGHHGPSNVTTQKTSDVRPPGIMSGDSKTEPSLYEDFVTSLSTPQTQVAFTSNYEGPKNKRKRQLNSIARYISSSDSSLITGHALVPLMSENLMLEKQDEKKGTKQKLIRQDVVLIRSLPFSNFCTISSFTFGRSTFKYSYRAFRHVS